MNLLDLAQDNLLDIICLIAADPSPRNVLWIGNIAQTCKLFYKLSKHSKVWLELSKTWFLPQHAKNNRIGFITEVFKYNFPGETNEYNLIKVVCEEYREKYPHHKVGEICPNILNNFIVLSGGNDYKGFELFELYEKDTKIIKKPTHSMLICMCRFDKGKQGVTHDSKGRWINDPHYIKLAKNISEPTKYTKNEIFNCESSLSIEIKKFNDNIYKRIKIADVDLIYGLLILKTDFIISSDHFTRWMDDAYSDYQDKFPRNYIERFTPDRLYEDMNYNLMF